MSKKRIEDLISYDFHTPNTEDIREFLALNYETDCYSDSLWDESDSYLTPSNSGMYTSNTQWGEFISSEDFKSIIGMADSQPTYTKPELSYISELEDRVEYLEALCSDYAAEIERLRGVEIGPQEFKPIAEMTIEDWEVAMLHAWEFETISKGNVVVIELDDFNECLPIRVKTSESKCQWLNENGLGTDNPEWSIVKRTK